MTAIKKYILKPISNDLITKRENAVSTTYNSANIGTHVWPTNRVRS